MRESQRIQLTEAGTPGVAASLPPGARILRGERRLVVPSPEFPDPASADPEKLLHHFLTSQWDYNPDQFRRIYSGPPERPRPDHTLGVHWTTRPVISERFTEHSLSSPDQIGRPMGDLESYGIRENDVYEMAQRSRRPFGRKIARELENRTDPLPEDPESYYQSYKPNVFHGGGAYRDLSGTHQYRGRSPSPDAAAPFRMGVVWHGRLDHSALDLDSRVTGFESEIDLKPGSSIQIDGATMHIPEAGRPLDYIGKGNWNHVQFRQPLTALIYNRLDRFYGG